MRNEAEVSQRTRELISDLRNRYVKDRTSQCCVNCAYNARCVQRSVDFRYCTLKTVTSACDTNHQISKLFVCDTDEWAKNCPDFKHKCDKEKAENEFNEIIRSPSRCGQVFPHLAALLWTLQAPDSAQSQPNPSWFTKFRKTLKF